jgi:transposase InsO family protein
LSRKRSRLAVWKRKPDAGLVHHSGQGSRYVSLLFGQSCHRARIDRSMGANGYALDNAICESFFASLTLIAIVLRKPIRCAVPVVAPTSFAKTPSGSADANDRGGG